MMIMGQGGSCRAPKSILFNAGFLNESKWFEVFQLMFPVGIGRVGFGGHTQCFCANLNALPWINVV